MNKLYSVHDHWTDINKKNDVDIESIDGVITGIKVNGEDYGGGGSSDFRKVNVLSVTKKDNVCFIALDVLAQNTQKNDYFYLTAEQITDAELANITETTPFIIGDVAYGAEEGYYAVAYYCDTQSNTSKEYGGGLENENFTVFIRK